MISFERRGNVYIFFLFYIIDRVFFYIRIRVFGGKGIMFVLYTGFSICLVIY